MPISLNEKRGKTNKQTNKSLWVWGHPGLSQPCGTELDLPILKSEMREIQTDRWTAGWTDRHKQTGSLPKPWLMTRVWRDNPVRRWTSSLNPGEYHQEGGDPSCPWFKRRHDDPHRRQLSGIMGAEGERRARPCRIVIAWERTENPVTMEICC